MGWIDTLNYAQSGVDINNRVFLSRAHGAEIVVRENFMS